MKAAFFLECQNFPWCNITSGTHLAPDFIRLQSMRNLKQWQSFGDFARSPLNFWLMLQFSIQENNGPLYLLCSEQKVMKKEKLWQRHQIVPGFVCIVYAHHMSCSKGDKSVTNKHLFLIKNHKVKMLHHRVPTYLIEYQQKIIEVSMQISYRKQKHFIKKNSHRGRRNWNQSDLKRFPPCFLTYINPEKATKRHFKT